VLDVYSVVVVVDVVVVIVFFFSFFKRMFKSLTDLFLLQKIGGGGRSKCSVFEEQNYEKVIVMLDISAVKSLHSL